MIIHTTLMTLMSFFKQIPVMQVDELEAYSQNVFIYSNIGEPHSNR